MILRTMTDADLIKAIESLKAKLITVSTGGPRINDVNDQYQQVYAEVAATLKRRSLENPNPFDDLWQWHGRWSSGDLPSYASRRAFVADMYGPLLNRIRTWREEAFEETGWPRVDRTVGALRDKLAASTTEEEFQSVGLLCRETLISLAQAIYDAEKYPTLDGVRASETDAKRMLEAFIAAELSGGANDEARKHARSALELALKLQHDRTAEFRDAAMCVEATTSVTNIIAIVSGRRDPDRR